MTSALLIWLFVPFLGGLALSVALESLLRPAPVAVWRRPAAAVCIHVGIFVVAYGIELALFRRPVFAMVNVLALQAIVVLVSNAKYDALREPFVYPDFEYFLDALKHPRLYLPFFGRLKAAAAGGGYGLALLAGLTLEESLTGGAGLWVLSFAEWFEEPPLTIGGMHTVFAIALVVWVGAGGCLVAFAGRRDTSLAVDFDASADLRRLGLFASLWRYRQAERKVAFITSPFENTAGEQSIRRNAASLDPATPTRNTATTSTPTATPTPIATPTSPATQTPTAAQTPTGTPTLPTTIQPDIVVIQSESFFDARRHFDDIRPEVLQHFDALKSAAVEQGTLRVAAWGANTVRTEFAFLSGVHPDALGIHKYNPYRRLARSGFPTLATHLRSLGYRTLCIHPYPDSFYTRNKVYPVLGFDEFMDIRAFADSARFGPYISDEAVAQRVRQVLDERRSAQPLFIFVITMENHGPLHWETVGDEDRRALFSRSPDASCNDLVAYVRHLRNADAMFKSIADHLAQHTRPAALCIYGDHVPIMPGVYAARGEPSGDTDYLIWRPPGQSGPAQVWPEQTRHVHELAQKLMRHVS